MAVTRFEDLIAWQKARVLTRKIYAVTAPKEFGDWGLARQIQRAAVSVMSNIAEGFERNTPREFYRFLSIAKGSCGEVRSLLIVAQDNGSMQEGVVAPLMRDSAEVARLIGGLRQSVGRSCRASPLGTRNSELGTRESL